jgi:phosphoribosyl 1,2-cyclic phosphodiesterase
MPINLDSRGQEEYPSEYLCCNTFASQRRTNNVKFFLPPLSNSITPVLMIKVLFRTIVIDVGKNFQAAALEWFPKYGLRRLDAVLITHAHADGVSELIDVPGSQGTYKTSSYEWFR